ncbi:proline/glycine betaine ABC transporter permease [Paraburkholderia nemoris]|uniref:ABC transporter permease n=1 Tax=Paraburkholderia nemoris TaxID=2793076 RepID=UPI00190E4389|nr:MULTISPECIES: proline/glycine betaine ABC transporter permease [Paraburkholderia]MBK5151896.1 proline/glycine betaine ABC transporter permease [Burkholderia sp. R-69608]MBK3739832.1 proline/glycine betaine ABC transporter permease [Paraburkholderia aspalathi]MBK3785201.1 proline/glycine betaine ABC transporter permease [Paraburkholderia aspalathi]CAE6717080.1 Glycine betaine/choline transport system permease protein OusW [Paraburkholderia nemoris]CAE6834140.1 Glycine betaine/choline transpo
MHSFFLHLSIADWVNDAVQSFVTRYGDSFHQFSIALLRYVLVPLEGALRALPPWLILLAVGAVTWNATRRLSVAGFFMLLLYAIGCFGLWEKLMQTLALMLVATVLSVSLGVPLGILTSRSAWLRRVLLPTLDVMQTLPSFVYLIPVLMLFGLGKVPAILATIIYALPPLIRLTDLGIRHVDGEVVEAARAFGTTRWQLLVNVQMPLARPSIMAGINQTTMMALSMVVIASMIGSRGLGEDVLAGIQTLDVGKGTQAGIAIVILAIVIDRISQGYGQDRRARRVLAQRRKARAASRIPYRVSSANTDETSAAEGGLETRTAK